MRFWTPTFVNLLIHQPLCLIAAKSKMGDVILSSPCIPKGNKEWPTPAHAIIHGMYKLRFSQRDIVHKTGTS